MTPHYLLSVDPGKRSIAWATWGGAELLRCGFITTDQKHFASGINPMVEGLCDELYRSLPPEHGGTVWNIAVELPRVYPQIRHVRPNDLIDLAAVAGAVAALGNATFVHPRTWKGQVPKTIKTARTLEELSAVERGKTEGKIKNHNIMDAIGIGLWWLKERGLR